jgi:hypothetical protein
MSETPRTWPEYAEPTPEQLADWLAVATRDERVKFAERAIHDARTAGDCFMRNHAAIEREIDYLRGRVATIRQETLDEFLAEWERRSGEQGADQ